MSKFGPHSLWRLVKNRLNREDWENTQEYWDERTETYEGLARSNWPSSSYNQLIHDRQMRLLDGYLGDVASSRIIDLGCGTGRTVRHLVERGAEVVGVDFSSETVAAAQRESQRHSVPAEFYQHDVTAAPREAWRGAFDAAISTGCVSVACDSRESLEKTSRHIRSMLGDDGQLVFMEPIHSSWLLRRKLALSPDEFIGTVESAGFRLNDRKEMNFLPVRYFGGFIDWPYPVLAPVYKFGEALLEELGEPEHLADYTCLLMERT